MKTKVSSNGRVLAPAVMLAMLCAFSGCNSRPDTSYIKSETDFLQACFSCRVCGPKVEGLCIQPGTRCENLCPRSETKTSWWLKGPERAGTACRCIGTNDIWVFDSDKKEVYLRKAPINDNGDEIK